MEQRFMQKIGVPTGARVEWDLQQGLAIMGCCGFLGFSEECIRLRTDKGVLCITGRALEIERMENGRVLLCGKIEAIAMERDEPLRA